MIDPACAGEVRPINQGTTDRFHRLAAVEVGDGRAIVSVFRGRPCALPFRLRLMERHPLGSQAFVPLQGRPWLAVVCRDPHDASSYRAFACGGDQGLNYAPGVWHHPLLALEGVSDFLVVDREGDGANLEEVVVPFEILVE